MNARRKFLTMLAAAPVAAVLEWDPLATRIFLPPRGGWSTKKQFVVMSAAADVVWLPLYGFESLEPPFKLDKIRFFESAPQPGENS